MVNAAQQVSEDPGRVIVSDHGSVVSFEATTVAAYDTLDSFVDSESWQWLGRSLVVDHRFAEGLVELLQDSDVEVVHV